MSGHGLRVLALTPYPETAPSTRFRLVQMKPALAGLGVDLDVRPFLSTSDYEAIGSRGSAVSKTLVLARSLKATRRTVEKARDYDAVLVQRGIAVLFDRGLLNGLVKQGTPILYDFDDAVFLPQEGGRRWLEALRSPAKTTEAFCRSASVVLAGNEYLADFARRAAGADGEARVRVLPSVVDTHRFRPAEAREGSLPTLGWIGSDTTIPYLESLASPLRDLADRVPHRLVVVSKNRRPWLPEVEYDFVPWDPSNEVARFQELDVGLYPLTETPWSLGKCGFKAIQYLSCGVPCVASPVGVLTDIVRHEETGLHAVDPSGWVEGAARLLDDASERRRMGLAGRELVEHRYSVKVAAPLLGEAIQDAVSQGSSSASTRSL